MVPLEVDLTRVPFVRWAFTQMPMPPIHEEAFMLYGLVRNPTHASKYLPYASSITVFFSTGSLLEPGIHQPALFFLLFRAS
jgi:hypothetical protein